MRLADRRRESIVAGEFAENQLRKDFTISERVAIADAIAEIECEAAADRMKAGKKSTLVTRVVLVTSQPRKSASVGCSHAVGTLA
jgi:hypothetical protein